MSSRRPARRGMLVAIEGIDGAGKSTLAPALARVLRARGLSVAMRHEPSDPRLSALAQSVSPEDAWTGAVYFTVDRYLARPALERALERHDVVVTDRSFYSTLAYQGSALPARERRRLLQLERAATVEPDRVLLLEVEPRVALGRLAGRRARSPLEKRRTLERVARAYRGFAREHHWVVLPATAPLPELARQAAEAVRPTRARRRGRRR
jgi:dTMP kinase